MTSPALIPLFSHSFLRVSGPDATRFLNGQLSNDVTLASRSQAIHATALNAKGGLEAICCVRRIEDDYLLDAPGALRDGLRERLDRYLIADDVVLSDESDHWKLSHVIASSSPPDASSIHAAAINRFGMPGFDLLAREESELPEFPVLSENEILELRISQGIPAWGAELTPGLLPPEAGLEQTAISYEKGCYLGQEVISRMKWAGKTNRHLIQLEVPSGTTPGQEFFHEGSAAGLITSVSPSSTQGRALALGFRKRKFEKIRSFSLPEEDDAIQVTKRLS